MLTAELMDGKEKVIEPKLSNFVPQALLITILPGYSHIHTLHSLPAVEKFPARQIPPAI